VAPSSRREREAREAKERAKRYAARQQVHDHKLARRKRDNVVAAGVLVVVAALATVAQLFYFADGPGAPTPTPSASPSAATPEARNVGPIPSPHLAEGRMWTGELVLNEDVKLGIELHGQKAPLAVSVFLQEAEAGYYDGKTCHRLVQSETAGLLQCGSADGQGAGDPEFSFGPLENTPEGGVYPAGTIAMARGADGYSQGRQFFVVFQQTQLPDDAAGGYTVIGKVTSGLDTLVGEIVDAGLDPLTSETDGTPRVATTISSVTIS
jgi:peptidyl-prolyl cis-trans isomerase B (cyclophilin B)